MKKIISICLFITNLFVQSYAQNTDSLWKVYKDKTKPDTCHINALQKIAMSFVSNNPDTTIILAQEALKLAGSLSGKPAKIWTAKALNSLGISYSYKGNYTKALEYYTKTLDIYKELDNKSGIA